MFVFQRHREMIDGTRNETRTDAMVDGATTVTERTTTTAETMLGGTVIGSRTGLRKEMQIRIAAGEIQVLTETATECPKGRRIFEMCVTGTSQ